MKKDLDRKWMCSLNEEYWEAVEYFDTKEEAIKYGIEAVKKFNKNPEEEYLDDEMGSTPEEVVTSFYVGQAFCPGLPFSIDDLLERVQEFAYEDGGEFAEGYGMASGRPVELVYIDDMSDIEEHTELMKKAGVYDEFMEYM